MRALPRNRQCATYSSTSGRPSWAQRVSWDLQNRCLSFSAHSAQNGSLHSALPCPATTGWTTAQAVGSAVRERVQLLRWRMHNPAPLTPKRQPGTVQDDRTERPFSAGPGLIRKAAMSGRPSARHRVLCPPHRRFSPPRAVAAGHRARRAAQHRIARGGEIHIDPKLRADRDHQPLQQPTRRCWPSDWGDHSPTSRPVNQPAATNVARASSTVRWP